ncbi:MAG: cyclic nucleotide-binding domain-containing protein [Bacteroidia bacterium]
MKKILIIEGNEKIRENTCKILSLANYSIISAESGVKGIELAKSERPDLIICNSLMPDIDGNCISNILSKNKETAMIPFVMLNTLDNNTAISNNNKLIGDNDYLLKSFESVSLLNAIDHRLKTEGNHTPAPAKTSAPNLDCLMQLINDSNNSILPENLTCDYRTRNYDKREYIYYEGDAPTTVYLVKKGRVKTVKIGPEGKEFIIGIYEKGEFFGHVAVFEGCDCPDTAIAIEETEVLLIPKEDFMALINVNHLMAVRFIKMLSSDINDKEERLKTLAFNSVRARVAGALLQLQKKHPPQGKKQSGPFTIHVLRDDLAGLIGTTTESLVRTLTDFKHENIVETDKGEITILDADGLERIKKFS